MSKEEYLLNLKVGDAVTRFFHGAGFVTQGEDDTVVFLNESHIWIHEPMMEDDSNYNANSVYAYDRKTGKATQGSFGMFHTIELPGSVAPDSE